MSKSPKWYVQVFRNKNGTNHLKDIIIEAPSAEEAKKIAKRKLPEGQHFYAAEYKADTLDTIADSLRRVADGVDGLERRVDVKKEKREPYSNEKAQRILREQGPAAAREYLNPYAIMGAERVDPKK